LSRAGAPTVAPPLGRIEYNGPSEHMVLAILSRYYPGAETAWDQATASVALGANGFRNKAYTLGQTTGSMHAELARAFGTETMSAKMLRNLSSVMLTDLQAEVAEIPQLLEYEDRLRSCFLAVDDPGAAVVRQRIHGDYHLGQVLDVGV